LLYIEGVNSEEVRNSTGRFGIIRPPILPPGEPVRDEATNEENGHRNDAPYRSGDDDNGDVLTMEARKEDANAELRPKESIVMLNATDDFGNGNNVTVKSGNGLAKTDNIEVTRDGEPNNNEKSETGRNEDVEVNNDHDILLYNETEHKGINFNAFVDKLVENALNITANTDGLDIEALTTSFVYPFTFEMYPVVDWITIGDTKVYGFENISRAGQVTGKGNDHVISLTGNISLPISFVNSSVNFFYYNQTRKWTARWELIGITFKEPVINFEILYNCLFKRLVVKRLSFFEPIDVTLNLEYPFDFAPVGRYVEKQARALFASKFPKFFIETLRNAFLNTKL